MRDYYKIFTEFPGIKGYIESELMLATIVDKQEIARGTLLTKFNLLEQKVQFAPGQYFFLTIPKLYYPDKRGNRRHFSIVNSPEEKSILSFATRISDSGFKKTLLELPLESEVEVGPIQGGFVLPEEKNLCFIAGGIGITPFMSMLETMKIKKLQYSITLFYFNKDKESTAFFAELNHLVSEIPGLTIIFVMTEDFTWEGEQERINTQMVKKYLPDYRNAFFMVAGPPMMNVGSVNVLKELGVEEVNIKQENFSGY